VSAGLRWAALVAVLALAIGGLGGAILLPPLLPPSADSADGPRAVPVTDRAFDDAHTAAAIPELSRAQTLGLSGPGGMVTASSCTPGIVVETGDHLLSIDGEVRIALVTEVPLWRDLAIGSEGTDVAALQQALIDQGHDLNASGEYDWATVAAVEAMQESAAVDDTGEIALDQVQWVPAGIGAVTSCEVGVGVAVAQGSPVLKAGGTLVALSFPASSNELPDRSYSAVAGDLVVPIGDDGRLADPELMRAVAASAAFADWVKDPARGVAVGIRLSEPISAIGIPPAAVVTTGASNGCIVVAGGPGDAGDERVPVTILSSELGTVFAVADRPVDRVVVPAAEVVDSCG